MPLLALVDVDGKLRSICPIFLVFGVVDVNVKGDIRYGQEKHAVGDAMATCELWERARGDRRIIFHEILAKVLDFLFFRCWQNW